MHTKIALFSLIFLIACGKEVQISNKKLQSNSSLSDGNNFVTNAEGTLIRGTKDHIFANGTTYIVSIYSSYSALEFVAKKPMQSQTPVRYRGKFRGNEMVLEYIEAK